MSAGADQASILSREELGALLSSLQDGRTSPGTRPIGMPDAGRGELQNLVARFASEQGRSLSTLYQTSISFRFSHLEEISLRQFAGAMLATDRIARLDLGAGGQDAYLLLSRPLVFCWMMMAFGARPAEDSDLIPARRYTRIEERFLQRSAEAVTRTFAKTLNPDAPSPPGVVAIEDPSVLFDRSKRPHRVVTVDVEGFGEPSSLRIALPPSLIDEGVSETPVPSEESSSEIAGQLLETPVQLRVQVGSAELPLDELSQLAVGDELRIAPAANEGSLVVNVESTPRFRAESGKLGKRLAVRITEVIQS